MVAIYASEAQFPNWHDYRDTRLTLMRRNMVNMQDGLHCVPDRSGAFHFIGVPAEPILLRLQVPGYQLTPRDHLLKSGSSTNLDIANDVTILVIEMLPEGSR